MRDPPNLSHDETRIIISDSVHGAIVELEKFPNNKWMLNVMAEELPLIAVLRKGGYIYPEFEHNRMLTPQPIEGLQVIPVRADDSVVITLPPSMNPGHSGIEKDPSILSNTMMNIEIGSEEKIRRLKGAGESIIVASIKEPLKGAIASGQNRKLGSIISLIWLVYTIWSTNISAYHDKMVRLCALPGLICVVTTISMILSNSF